MAWATLIDKYIQKIAASVKPDQIILLTTGAASDLPEELLLPLLRPGVAAAGLDPGVLVIGALPRSRARQGRSRGRAHRTRTSPSSRDSPSGFDGDHHR